MGMTILLALLGAAAGWLIADRSGGRISMPAAIAAGAAGAVIGSLVLGLLVATAWLLLRVLVGLGVAVLLIALVGRLGR